MSGCSAGGVAFGVFESAAAFASAAFFASRSAAFFASAAFCSLACLEAVEPVSATAKTIVASAWLRVGLNSSVRTQALSAELIVFVFLYNIITPLTN